MLTAKEIGMKVQYDDSHSQSICSFICENDERYLDQVSVVDDDKLEDALKKRIQYYIAAIYGFESVDFAEINVMDDCTIYKPVDPDCDDDADDDCRDYVDVEWNRSRDYNEMSRITIKYNGCENTIIIACNSATCGTPEMKFPG